MKIVRLASVFLTATTITISTATITLAQTTDPSPSPSTDPSTSLSPSPSSSPATSPSPSESTAAGGTTKSEVLGETTKLGDTGREKEIAKWAIAITLAIAVFIVGIKTASSSAKD